jgi:hypothetical protein
MTASYGLGMLLMGIIALSIASVIAYLIIAKVVMKNKKVKD